MAVAEVARTAQLLCGAAPVEEALLSVRLQPGEATGAAGQLLESLGLRTDKDAGRRPGAPRSALRQRCCASKWTGSSRTGPSRRPIVRRVSALLPASNR